jgi:hypothetical protein
VAVLLIAQQAVALAWGEPGAGAPLLAVALTQASAPPAAAGRSSGSGPPRTG